MLIILALSTTITIRFPLSSFRSILIYKNYVRFNEVKAWYCHEKHFYIDMSAFIYYLVEVIRALVLYRVDLVKYAYHRLLHRGKITIRGFRGNQGIQ